MAMDDPSFDGSHPIRRPSSNPPDWQPQRDLTDDEWQAVRKASGLPDEARHEIQGLVDLGRSGFWRVESGAPTKAKLETVIPALELAEARIASLLPDDQALFYIFASEPNQMPVCAPFVDLHDSDVDALQSLAVRLAELRQQCSDAIQNIPSRSGPVPEEYEFAIHWLDSVCLEHLGRTLTNSGNRAEGVKADREWVADIMRFFIPDIKTRAIRTAIGVYRKKHPQITKPRIVDVVPTRRG